MNYTNNPANVRISLFKKSGKWYADGSVEMTGYKGQIHESVKLACNASYFSAVSAEEGWPVVCSPDEWLDEGGLIVCLDPYHQHAHPICLKR